MDIRDHYIYHKANAEGFHYRAQVARKRKKSLTDKGDFLGALKADQQWREYMRSRDEHKRLARSYRGKL